MNNLMDFIGLGPDVAKVGSSAILGGIAFKIVEKFLNGKSFVNEHTALRTELREELNSVREEVVRLRAEVDTWREKYYEQLTLTTELHADIINLRHDIAEYKSSNEHSIAEYRKSVTDEN